MIRCHSNSNSNKQISIAPYASYRGAGHACSSVFLASRSLSLWSDLQSIQGGSRLAPGGGQTPRGRSQILAGPPSFRDLITNDGDQVPRKIMVSGGNRLEIFLPAKIPLNRLGSGSGVRVSASLKKNAPPRGSARVMSTDCCQQFSNFLYGGNLRGGIYREGYRMDSKILV